MKVTMLVRKDDLQRLIVIIQQLIDKLESDSEIRLIDICGEKVIITDSQMLDSEKQKEKPPEKKRKQPKVHSLAS